jgi:hypothetical protein
MKWFKRWVVRKGHAWEQESNVLEVATCGQPSRLNERDQDWQDNLNIAITTACGGKIVTFRRYDHKTDRSNNRVYVIPDEQNFNDELAKLITLESMRG